MAIDVSKSIQNRSRVCRLFMRDSGNGKNTRHPHNGIYCVPKFDTDPNKILVTMIQNRANRGRNELLAEVF